MTRRRSCSCPTPEFFTRVLDFFDIDLRIAHVGDQLLRPFAESINLFGLIQVLQKKTLCLGDSRTAESIF